MNPAKPASRGISTGVILALVAIVVVAGVGVAMMRSGSASSDPSAASGMFEVRRGSFDITVPATGELTALESVEIRNSLDVNAVIMEIVDEGVTVARGDVLIRFNDDDLRDRIKDEEDDVAASNNAHITAEAKLEITIKEQESEIDKADLKIELALIALEAWREGDTVAKKEELALAKETADKNFERLKDRFEESKGLLEKKFISRDDYRRDEIDMIEAQARLVQANRDVEVYEKYTSVQEKKQKQSDVDQAIAERDRVGQYYEAQVRQVRSDVESRAHALASDEDRLSEFRQQLEFCTVLAPSDGLVVYTTSLESGRHGRDEPPPQVGTVVSKNRRIMLLPDTSQMVAAIKVNEALVGLIAPGQKAFITSDALPDVTIEGTVLDVGVLAETGGWRDPNRRDYTVSVLLVGGNEHGLKPSMRATGTIYIDRVEDALHVPVPAIRMDGGQASVYVPQGSGYAKRRVTVGRSSEMYVEIVSGLEPGDRVLLRDPSTEEITGEDDGGPSEIALDGGTKGEGGARANRGDRPRGERGRRGAGEGGRPARAGRG